MPDVVLKHPRIFEYKVMEDGKALQKGAARIQVCMACVEGEGNPAACVGLPASSCGGSSLGVRLQSALLGFVQANETTPFMAFGTSGRQGCI